ncbi:ATP-binding cassette domain-containing protein [Actinomyces sp. MRS3W]|uniref:ATP-binding cassette domain-containing protein n=1 Tax=Actinomyces sp. MRS3W TaxID=2800796 RepID=UPI0028FDB998|nr:ATP-binding cassette domain-containing protein [Actinomyces sp. MRS3W]MDU0347698.1 ATP-binding cassette domain-containing protein [Actinomyces sp. MRS3W]
MQLTLSAVRYTYPDAAFPALTDVTATFPVGWTGVVGDNGCGKTTLARLACRLLEPDSGTISPRLTAHYCPQDASQAPPELEDFACAYDAIAVRLRRDLGIEDDWAWRYSTASSGQQKRLQVACALWLDPDVLVLDEPTNHVDAAAGAAIRAALASFTGIGILISHDRVLLDELCAQCLFLSGGTAVMRPGGYSQGSAQSLLERDTAVRRREQAKREKKRIAQEAQRRREEASRTASRRSGRHIAKHDNDARFKRRLAVVTGQDGKTGRLSSRMEARLARAEAQLDAMKIDKRYAADVWMDARASRRPVLMRTEPMVLPLGDTATLYTPELYLGNRDHVALVGDNGSGKTTLVNRLLAQLPDDVPSLYIPQEPGPEVKAAAVARLAALDSRQRGDALAIIAQLNSDPESMRGGGDISPGELRKLMLALGILTHPELIIMDEPTNHLDVGSIEALERLLQGYPGALLLVSHDAALVTATTEVTWAIRRESANRMRLSVR